MWKESIRSFGGIAGLDAAMARGGMLKFPFHKEQIREAWKAVKHRCGSPLSWPEGW